MSPRAADPGVRLALVEAAARLLSEHESFTLRRVAAEVGTSTMAVYTHFGSMDDLRSEVRREGFRRLAEHLAGVTTTTDAVADLMALAWAYCANALENQSLYRVMFMESTVDAADAASSAATFLPVVSAVGRCVDASRFSVTDPWDAAVEMWAFTHGIVTLTLGGMLSVEELARHMHGGMRACLLGHGDHPVAADRSLRRARRRSPTIPDWPGVDAKGATLATASGRATPLKNRGPKPAPAGDEPAGSSGRGEPG